MVYRTGGRSIWLVACASVALVAGCYQPDIPEGAFACGANDTCPEGFKCYTGRCYKTNPTAEPDAGMMCELPQVTCSGAAPSTDVCDPVCQRDCACGQRCTLTQDGPACLDEAANAAEPGGDCNALEDNCKAGLVCLAERFDVCGAHCYRFCRDHTDCGARSRCLGQAGFGDAQATVGVCSPRVEACNPIGDRPACASRADPNFGCYIMSTLFPDEPVCDCAGTTPAGAACTDLHECVPGFECINDGTERRCRKLCSIGVNVLNPVRCGIGMGCQPLGDSTRIGFCIPR